MIEGDVSYFLFLSETFNAKGEAGTWFKAGARPDHWRLISIERTFDGF
jgi:hypothetical protein